MLLVADLRSGLHRQETDVLKGTNKEGEVGYCCLGRACDISKLGKWKIADGLNNYTIENKTSLYFPENSQTLGGLNEVKEFYGFNHDEGLKMYDIFGELGKEDKNDSLAKLNDDGFTFKQIADIIEYATVNSTIVEEDDNF